jgi:RHS repeat-associated protein
MLDGVGLIHMNGRVYDPAVGRFLSVDPRVRDSAASQSWNGYAYVEARLLSATDPSGWATVDCPQCVVPIEPIVPTVTVTAPRLYPLGTIADFMAMWGGVDTSLQPSRPANEDAEREAKQEEKPANCPGVPSAPPGVDVGSNIDIASDHADMNPGSLIAFYQLVRNGRDWDYKQVGKVANVPSPYEAFGNFNYGATGAAMGIPDQLLLRAAGVASILAGTSPPNSSNPLWRAPYGDSPVDQAWIKQGIEYSRCMAGARP